MDLVRTAPESADEDASSSNQAVSGFASQLQQPAAVELDDTGIIAAPSAASAASASSNSQQPAEIPPEPAEKTEEAPNDVEDDEEEEDDDEYEYEDDDDAPFVSGFLVDNPSIAASRSAEEEAAAAPARIRDDDEEEESVDGTDMPAPKPKWREPSREAVNMSLRAEKETSGGKRRLMQDLYRIMNQDTEQAGFSLEPSSEDCMDKWSIKLFKFDKDSNLAKDMRVLGLTFIGLEMSFPEQYPFEPPFVRVVRPRFKRQTGFVMNGALCMELLTKDGWNPINDIESVIVSVRSLLVVGDGRLEAAYNLTETKYNELLQASEQIQPDAASPKDDLNEDPALKRQRKNLDGEAVKKDETAEQQRRIVRDQGGCYTVGEAEAAYSHLSDYHKKKGWDSSGWWKRKG